VITEKPNNSKLHSKEYPSKHSARACYGKRSSDESVHQYAEEQHSAAGKGIGLNANWNNTLICLALVLVTVGIYWQTTGFEFINYDDNVLVYENSHVRQGVTFDNLVWAFCTMPEGTWQPLTWLSHMLDCQLFGLKAGWHHLTSLLCHTLNAVLLFLLLARMTGARWRSALVAALFALHPFHIEPVVWVAERKEVLSTVGGLLTLLAYASWVEKRSSWKRYALILACFTAGLMAKPMLVTLPVLLLFLDFWPLNRLPLNFSHGQSAKTGMAFVRLVVEKIPLLLIALGSSVITVMAEMKIGTISSVEQFSLPDRVSNAIIAYTGYLMKTAWPAKLHLLYLYPDHIPGWQVGGSLALLLLITLSCLLTATRHPYLAVGWGWYLVSLLPVIGLVQLGASPIADRFTYLPLIGIFIMIAWGGGTLLNRWQDRIFWPTMLTCLCLLALLATVSFQQIGHWRDSRSLFSYILAVDPDNYEAAIQLGDEYRDTGEFEQAILHLTEATRLAPWSHEAYADLGNAYDKMGQLDEATRCYTEAIRINPGFIIVYDYLGLIGVKQGKLDMAKFYFGKALEYNPDDPKVWMNYGLALYLDNQLPEATSYFSKAIKAEPQSMAAHNGLGLIYMKEGRMAEAIKEFQTALDINPGYEHARENLQKARAAQAGKEP